MIHLLLALLTFQSLAVLSVWVPTQGRALGKSLGVPRAAHNLWEARIHRPHHHQKLQTPSARVGKGTGLQQTSN